MFYMVEVKIDGQPYQDYCPFKYGEASTFAAKLHYWVQQIVPTGDVTTEITIQQHDAEPGTEANVRAFAAELRDRLSVQHREAAAIARSA